jgi:hypothetical protein
MSLLTVGIIWMGLAVLVCGWNYCASVVSNGPSKYRSE